MTNNKRIVSLIASSTEIVCALGLHGQLVGRSHECDFPESIKKLPVCTEPKINPKKSSKKIDQDVKTLLKEALSVYRVNVGMLKKLEPDVIITQTQCEVCAVSLRDVKRALSHWTNRRPQIVSLKPNSLHDIWNDVHRISGSLGIPSMGRDLVKRLKKRLGLIAKKSKSLSPKPTVACIEWIEPLMAAGNWMPELVEMAGGINLFGQKGRHSPWMSWEELKTKNPDMILVLPCGFDLKRTKKEMTTLTKKPDWHELKAVRKAHVYLTDGNQYFNRPGPRLVESLEILAEIFYPQEFYFGHEKTGWEPLI